MITKQFKLTTAGRKWAVSTSCGYLCFAPLPGFYYMKYLMIALILMSQFATAQKRNDNCIILNTSFGIAIQKLSESGYSINYMDNKICVSAPNPDGLIITIKENDGNVILSGDYTASFFGSGTHAAYHVTYFKHGPIAKMWDEMMKYAEQFPNREYAKL